MMHLPPIEPLDSDQVKSNKVFDEHARLSREALVAKRNFLRVWTFIGVVVLIAAAGYVLNALSVVVGVLLWTLIIVFCLRGPVNFFVRLGLNRSLSTALAYILMTVVLFGVGALLLSPTFGLNDQLTSLAKSLPAYVEQLVAWGTDFYLRHADVLQNDLIQHWITDAANALSAWATNIARDSAGSVVAISSTVANGMVSFSFALVIAYWALLELPLLGKEVLRLGGEKYHEDLVMLHLSFSRVMGGYIKGTIIQCLVIGVACAVAFYFMNIPSYAALGAITGLLNIIPVVGPWIGGALTSIVAIFISPWMSLFTLIVTILIQQFVYTFISPRIMSNSVDIHPALILIAILAGSAIGSAMSGIVGGIVGMLASIPLLAWAKSIFVYYFEKKTGQRIVSEDGVFFKGSCKVDNPSPLEDATAPHPQADEILPMLEQVTGTLKIKRVSKDVKDTKN